MPAYLSLASSTGMNIMKINDCDPCIASVETNCTMKIVQSKDIVNQYEDLISGLGELQGEHHIYVNPQAASVVHPPRSIQVSLRNKLESKLKDLQRDGIIARADRYYWYRADAVGV